MYFPRPVLTKKSFNNISCKHSQSMAVSLLSCCHASFTCHHSKHNTKCFRTCTSVRILKHNQHAYTKKSFYVQCASKGSADSSKSEETVPSWAKPDSKEPPPWARDEGNQVASQQGFELPFIVYLLASAVTAIAAVGSVFEYINQRPVFGVLNSDSIFYAPILGFFAFTGIPTSAFLWFKSVQVANKEAEEQDRRDGYK